MSADPDSQVTYVGHSTLLLEIEGTRLLTDPVLRSWVAILRRLAPVPEIEGLLEPDAVLISHAHLDHLDLWSLRRMPGDPVAIAPHGCRRLLERGGLRKISEISVGEGLKVGNVEIEATPASHDGRRYRFTRKLPALGYVISGPTTCVYFAGDTDLFDGMRKLAPHVDVALLPIAGWGRTLGPGHLDAEGAAKAAALIRPRIAIPIHWGTLVGPSVSRALAMAPAREFARHLERLAPGVEPRILTPGESLTLDQR